MNRKGEKRAIRFRRWSLAAILCLASECPPPMIAPSLIPLHSTHLFGCVLLEEVLQLRDDRPRAAVEHRVGHGRRKLAPSIPDFVEDGKCRLGRRGERRDVSRDFCSLFFVSISVSSTRGKESEPISRAAHALFFSSRGILEHTHHDALAEPPGRWRREPPT